MNRELKRFLHAAWDRKGNRKLNLAAQDLAAAMAPDAGPRKLMDLSAILFTGAREVFGDVEGCEGAGDAQVTCEACIRSNVFRAWVNPPRETASGFTHLLDGDDAGAAGGVVTVTDDPRQVNCPDCRTRLDRPRYGSNISSEGGRQVPSPSGSEPSSSDGAGFRMLHLPLDLDSKVTEMPVDGWGRELAARAPDGRWADLGGGVRVLLAGTGRCLLPDGGIGNGAQVLVRRKLADDD